MTLSEWHEATKNLPPRFSGDNVECPRCGAHKGERCRVWDGFRRSSPHVERVLAASRLSPRLIRRIATAMWEADGRPERDPNDPTTVGRRDYDEWAKRALEAIAVSGWRVVPRS